MQTSAPSSAEAARIQQFHRNKWFFSVGGIGRDMAYALVGTFLLTYLQFGVSMTLSQFTVLALLIGVIGRIWDGVNDPIMGSIIENVHFKWGKFKPWIFLGAVLTGLFIILMFNVRCSGWGFVVYILAQWIMLGTMFVVGMNNQEIMSVFTENAAVSANAFKIILYSVGGGYILFTAILAVVNRKFLKKGVNVE